MLVDTDLLRCGAEFSGSAGEIAQRGAHEFAATPVAAGIFGDFEAARGFHRVLCCAHRAHVATMEGHRVGLEVLSQKVHSAAAVFLRQDEANGSAVESAGLRVT